jgi:hypothetical protein
MPRRRNVPFSYLLRNTTFKNTGYEANALQAVRSGRWGKPERPFPPNSQPRPLLPVEMAVAGGRGGGARFRQGCSSDRGSVSHSKGLRDAFMLRVEAVEQQGGGQGAARGCSAAQKTPCRTRLSTQLMHCVRVRLGAGAVEKKKRGRWTSAVCLPSRPPARYPARLSDGPRCSGDFCSVPTDA